MEGQHVLHIALNKDLRKRFHTVHVFHNHTPKLLCSANWGCKTYLSSSCSSDGQTHKHCLNLHKKEANNLGCKIMKPLHLHRCTQSHRPRWYDSSFWCRPHSIYLHSFIIHLSRALWTDWDFEILNKGDFFSWCTHVFINGHHCCSNQERWWQAFICD